MTWAAFVEAVAEVQDQMRTVVCHPDDEAMIRDGLKGAGVAANIVPDAVMAIIPGQIVILCSPAELRTYLADRAARNDKTRLKDTVS